MHSVIVRVKMRALPRERTWSAIFFFFVFITVTRF